MLTKDELDERLLPDHPVTLPECFRFWRQVLTQALADALDPRDMDRDDDLTDAVAFVRLDNPDFVELCDNSGYDAEEVYRHYRKYELDNVKHVR